jgi:glutamyl-tRNA reductase
LASKFNGRALRFEELYDTADQADIIISSTGAPVAIFRKEHGERFMARRRNRPMFFIDIAVPRDVDAAMNDVDGVFVYDIDDLQQVVASHLSDRKKEAAKAEDIVKVEVERFAQRMQTLDVVPTILSLQEYLEDIRQAEIDRYRSRLGQISSEQEAAIDAMTHAMINKIMHTPIVALKTAAKDPESTTVIDVIRRLFNLQEKARGNSAGDGGQN